MTEPRTAAGRAHCICGAAILADNADNHLLRRDGKRLAMADLDAIRARLGAMKRGQWWARTDGGLSWRVVSRNRPLATQIPWESDAILFAAAPDDIAALLAEVDRLRAAEGQTRAALEGVGE